MRKHVGTMYAHKLIDWPDDQGHGLSGAYDGDAILRSDLAFFAIQSDAEREALRIGEMEEMAPVRVVKVRITVEEDE